MGEYSKIANWHEEQFMRVNVIKNPFTLGPTLGPILGLSLGLSLQTIGAGALADESRLTSFTHSFISGCANEMESGFDQSTSCLIDQVLPVALDLVESSGVKAFGARFNITERLSYSHTDGLRGEFDVIFPLSGAQGSAPQAAYADGNAGLQSQPAGAFFMQQGASIWMDEDGSKRHDFRVGMVRRFQPGGHGAAQTRADLLGLSLFQQHNLEYGHSRSVIGLDFVTGPSSEAALHYYLPTSGWLNTISGYEEHALQGVEASASFDLPLSLELAGAIGQWHVPGEAIHSSTSELDLSWAYNRWTGLSANWRESEIDDSGSSGFGVNLKFNIPLGGGASAPGSLRDLWRYAAKGDSADGRRSAANLQEKAWRPSTQKGEILYVRRAIAEVDAPQAGEVKAEFMQDAAHTGSSVKIKVSISEPASEDQRYLLRLRPGAGETPAVEGEDFNGEPVVVQINQGERETFTAIQLILNSAMRVSRNLDVSVTRWSEDALAVATP